MSSYYLNKVLDSVPVYNIPKVFTTYFCYSWFPFQVFPEGVEAGGQPWDDGGCQLVLPNEQPLVRTRRPHATGNINVLYNPWVIYV